MAERDEAVGMGRSGLATLPGSPGSVATRDLKVTFDAPTQNLADESRSGNGPASRPVTSERAERHLPRSVSIHQRPPVEALTQPRQRRPRP
jgi:hypothetical protein